MHPPSAATTIQTKFTLARLPVFNLKYQKTETYASADLLCSPVHLSCKLRICYGLFMNSDNEKLDQQGSSVDADRVPIDTETRFALGVAAVLGDKPPTVSREGEAIVVHVEE